MSFEDKVGLVAVIETNSLIRAGIESALFYRPNSIPFLSFADPSDGLETVSNDRESFNVVLIGALGRANNRLGGVELAREFQNVDRDLPRFLVLREDQLELREVMEAVGSRLITMRVLYPFIDDYQLREIVRDYSFTRRQGLLERHPSST